MTTSIKPGDLVRAYPGLVNGRSGLVRVSQVGTCGGRPAVWLPPFRDDEGDLCPRGWYFLEGIGRTASPAEVHEDDDDYEDEDEDEDAEVDA